MSSRSSWLFAFVFLSLLFSFCSAGFSDEVAEQTLEKLVSEAGKARARLDKLTIAVRRANAGLEKAKEALRESEVAIANLRAEERASKARADELGAQLSLQREEQSALLLLHRERLLSVYREVGRGQRSEGRFLKASYKLEVLKRYVNRVAAADKKILLELLALISKGESLAQELALEQERIKIRTAQLSEEKQRLAKRRASQEELSAKLLEEKETESRALLELEARALRLEAALANLSDRLPERDKVKPLKLKGLRKQCCKPPLLSDSTVHSIEDGRIVFVGRLPGSPKSIIVDHGGRFHAIFKSVDKIRVLRGDYVKRGEELAAAHEETNFELRRRGRSIDAKPYFR